MPILGAATELVGKQCAQNSGVGPNSAEYTAAVVGVVSQRMIVAEVPKTIGRHWP